MCNRTAKKLPHAPWPLANASRPSSAARRVARDASAAAAAAAAVNTDPQSLGARLLVQMHARDAVAALVAAVRDHPGPAH